jgi:phosphonate transport system substrate-binding protein
MEDLEGHSFAFVNPVSGTGYFLPAFYLVNRFNLSAENILQPGYFFSATTFSNSHDTSIHGTILGDYDAAAVIATVFNSAMESGLINPDDIRIIGETPPGPDSSYIMRAELPEDLKNRIRSFFLALDNTEYFRDAWNFENLRFGPGNYEALEELRYMQEILAVEE